MIADAVQKKNQNIKSLSMTMNTVTETKPMSIPMNTDMNTTLKPGR